MTNKLFYGDNLDVLRESVADESVDLVNFDPPFNSNAIYSILFKSKTGDGADAQKAPIGVFITATLPTSVMLREAAAVGRFEDEWGRTYPRLQILTLAQLFQGEKPKSPSSTPPA